MNTNLAEARAAGSYPKARSIDLADLEALTARTTDLADYPYAAAVEKNVLIYQCDRLLPLISDPETRQQIMAEWAAAMMTGPGAIVFKAAEPDRAVIDRASDMFREMIAEQDRLGSGGGDHFAKPGANDRVWNSLEKHCGADPQNFARYYANPFLALVSEAWLGPNYQVTAQLNVVNPGGAAQSPHRDYHMGFQSAADIERFPIHVQLLSPLLTLQGAIAHVDAPIETGPTQLLPFSQIWPEGYLAMSRPEVRDHFAAHHVQVPLQKGDMLFFSPALFHAAGTNRSTNVRRMVNLFQVGSAYGRSIESINRSRMVKSVYPVLRQATKDGSLTPAQIGCVVAASAEGYSFPTNLDRDPPLGGMAPKTQAQLLKEALAGDWSPDRLAAELDAQEKRKLA